MTGMGKTKIKPKEHSPSRQILTDSHGKVTHVVLTVEEFERIAELIEDAEDLAEVEKRLENPEYVSLDEAKASLSL